MAKDLTTIIEEWLPKERIHQLSDDVGSPHETEHDRGHNDCIRNIRNKIPQLVEEIVGLVKDKQSIFDFLPEDKNGYKYVKSSDLNIIKSLTNKII